MYECYAEHLLTSKEVIRDGRVARFGGNRGQMGDVIPLNNYKKSAEHYLASGVSYAGHIATICQSNLRKLLLSTNWILFMITYRSLKLLFVKRLTTF
jgi:hypothetical protein